MTAPRTIDLQTRFIWDWEARAVRPVQCYEWSEGIFLNPLGGRLPMLLYPTPEEAIRAELQRLEAGRVELAEQQMALLNQVAALEHRIQHLLETLKTLKPYEPTK